MKRYYFCHSFKEEYSDLNIIYSRPKNNLGDIMGKDNKNDNMQNKEDNKLKKELIMKQKMMKH